MPRHARTRRRLPFISHVRLPCANGGDHAAAPVRRREYKRAHPGVRIYKDEPGEHYAWKAAPGDPFSGEIAYGRTEDELLAKLRG